MKAQVYAVDPVQPVMDVRTMEKLLSDEAYAEPRFNLLLFSVFAALGLALALFGIYGVISHAVSQQTREIGIRLALGASFRQVIGLILSTGIKLLGIGIVAGIVASLASVKVLARLVRVSTFDPYTFAGVTRPGLRRRPFRQLLARPPRRPRGSGHCAARRIAG